MNFSDKYKLENDNIKLTEKQKNVIAARMRQAESEKVIDIKKSKRQIPVWTKAVAAALAVAVIGSAVYIGRPGQEKAENIFSITANAAAATGDEAKKSSVIGTFSTDSADGKTDSDFGWVMYYPDYEGEDFDEGKYRKDGYMDYFRKYELKDFQVSGKNIASVTMKANKKGSYFGIEKKLNKFRNKDSIRNSQYSRKEFKKYSEDVFGYVCDSFTCDNKSPEDKVQKILPENNLSLIIESDHSDVKIAKLLEELYALAKKESSMIYPLTSTPEGLAKAREIEKSEEFKTIKSEIRTTQEKLRKRMLENVTLDVTVKFTDGTYKTESVFVKYKGYDKIALDYAKPKNKNGKTSFTITSNIKEAKTAESVIGAYTTGGDNGGSMFIEPMADEPERYLKDGCFDFFWDYNLENFHVKGKNIKSVSVKANKKGTYFFLYPQEFNDINEKGEDVYYVNGKVVNPEKINEAVKSELKNFTNHATLSNSQYTKDEFRKHYSNLMTGDEVICDGFTWVNPNPSDKKQELIPDNNVTLIVETDHSDPEIANWLDELWYSDKNTEKQMLKRMTENATIDVTVTFTDGRQETQIVNIDPDTNGIRLKR